VGLVARTVGNNKFIKVFYRKIDERNPLFFDV